MAGSPWIWPPVRVPSSLPPSGPAGGDLAGTYPNPTVPGLFGSGRILQLVRTESIAPVSTTSIIPVDNTVPQNTEGAEFTQLATTIIPLRSTSFLLVTVFLPMVTFSNIGQWAGALFRDAAADAIFACTQTTEASNRLRSCTMQVSVPSTAAVATTFKLRYGPGAAGTGYINMSGAAPGYFGGAMPAVMTVQEIAV